MIYYLCTVLWDQNICATIDKFGVTDIRPPVMIKPLNYYLPCIQIHNILLATPEEYAFFTIDIPKIDFDFFIYIYNYTIDSVSKYAQHVLHALKLKSHTCTHVQTHNVQYTYMYMYMYHSHPWAK